jgi:hypothetical protein
MLHYQLYKFLFYLTISKNKNPHKNGNVFENVFDNFYMQLVDRKKIL